jgi:uncharacterized protein
MRFSTRIQMALALMAAAVVLPVGGAEAAEVGCGRIRTATHRIICTTPGIAVIDRRHTRLYRDTVAKARKVSDRQAAARVRQTERNSRVQRAACGANAVCLRAAYKSADAQMIAYLKQLD